MSANLTLPRHSQQATLPPITPTPPSIQQCQIELKKHHTPSYVFPIIAASLVAFAILGVVTERIISISLHRPIQKKMYIASGICLLNAAPFLLLAIRSVAKFQTSKKNLFETAYSDLEQLNSEGKRKKYIKEKLLSEPDETKKRWHHTTQLHYLKNLKTKATEKKNDLIVASITTVEKELQKALENPSEGN